MAVDDVVPIPVRVEGGWGRRYSEPGEDRSFTMRIVATDNSLNIFEVVIPASAMLDLLTNTSAHDQAPSELRVLGGLDVVGKIRQWGSILIPEPDYGVGRRDFPLPDELVAGLVRAGWLWERDRNMHHRRDGQMYELRIDRVVSGEWVKAHPPSDLLALPGVRAAMVCNEPVVA